MINVNNNFSVRHEDDDDDGDGDKSPLLSKLELTDFGKDDRFLNTDF